MPGLFYKNQEDKDFMHRKSHCEPRVIFLQLSKLSMKEGYAHRQGWTGLEAPSSLSKAQVWVNPHSRLGIGSAVIDIRCTD